MRLIKSITTDFTSLSMYKNCPTKFSYRILQSMSGGGPSDALDFGKLIHKGLELINLQNITEVPEGVDHEIEYLSARNQPRTDASGLLGVLNHVANAAATSALFTLLPDERRSLRHLLLLLTAYVRNYGKDGLRATHVEIKHKIFLGRSPNGVNVYYSGTCDGLTADAVLEHKTTSYLNNGFVNRINPNDQATGYVALARDFLKNDKINTVIFDAISTGGYGKTPGAATARPASWALNTKPNTLFMRMETYRSDEQIAEWRDQVIHDVDRMAIDIEEARFSKNPETCTAYNSTCPFIDICRAADSQRGMLLDATLQQEVWDSFQINSE